jgi:hypothetical protein
VISEKQGDQKGELYSNKVFQNSVSHGIFIPNIPAWMIDYIIKIPLFRFDNLAVWEVPPHGYSSGFNPSRV